MKQLLIAAVCLLLLATGCGKKEFVVDFSLDSEVNGNFRIIYFASDARNAFWMESAAPVEGGKYHFTGPLVRPSLVYVFSHSDTEPSAIFYVEKGSVITVTGKGNNPSTWSFDGNKLTKEWSDWRLANSDALASSDPGKVNEAIAAYIVKNQDSRLSPLLLLTSYNRNVDPEGFMRLWKKIPEKVRGDKVVKLASAAEFASSVPFSPQGTELSYAPVRKMEKLRIHSLRNGLDTVTPDRPTLLWFWHREDSGRNGAIDSLRAVVKAWPDSAARNIVDISLDPDSVSWAGSCSGDSLKSTVRGWMPQGEVSPLAMKLGVVSTPAYIVADKTGKIVYRGSVIKDALGKFRALRPVKKSNDNKKD